VQIFFFSQTPWTAKKRGVPLLVSPLPAQDCQSSGASKNVNGEFDLFFLHNSEMGLVIMAAFMCYGN